jgi:pimeloyl-ACP methyl ester carboxylesterase
VPQVNANGLTLEYESLGSESDPALVLVMGLGAQLVRWPLAFCEKLVAQGFRVIRFDNRDIGLSTKLENLPVPSIPALMAQRMTGLPMRVPYTLADMARDTVGLMDALRIRQAHLVGTSMGGMIAQIVAADYPQRVLSLTSIMSTSGNRGLPMPTPAASAIVMTRAPHPSCLEAYVEHGLRAMRVLGSPAADIDEQRARDRLITEAKRSYYPDGFARQMAAVIASGDRRANLRRIKAPTMVVHGAEDPLVPLACGRDTAANIPNAEFRIVPGMGHDLPPMFFDTLVDAIVSVANRASQNAHQSPPERRSALSDR